jgi:hypothetical protein
MDSVEIRQERGVVPDCHSGGDQFRPPGWEDRIGGENALGIPSRLFLPSGSNAFTRSIFLHQRPRFKNEVSIVLLIHLARNNMKFEKRRAGLVILIEAAPGQGIGPLNKTIESGDTVRLFFESRPVLAVVSNVTDDGYTGFITTKEAHPPLQHGQMILFDEINVDAVFKKNVLEPLT